MFRKKPYNPLFDSKGLRVSDGGSIFLLAYVAMYLLQVAVAIVAVGTGKDEDMSGSLGWNTAIYACNFIAFFFSPVIYGKIFNKPMLEYSNIKKKVSASNLLFSVLIAFVSLLTFIPIANIFVDILMRVGYDVTGDAGPVINTIPRMLLFLFAVAVIPSIGEEFLFRGAVARALSAKNAVFAMILSSLLFSLMHGSAMQTVHQFLLGFVMCYVYLLSGSLWCPIIMHFFNNAFIVVVEYITTVSGSAAASPAPLGVTEYIVYVAIFVIGSLALLFLLRLMTKKVLREKNIEGNHSLKGEAAAFFKCIGNCFTIKGMRKNAAYLNRTLALTSPLPIDKKDDIYEEQLTLVTNESMRQALIKEQELNRGRVVRADRIAVALSIIIVAVIWIVNSVQKF